MSPQDWGYFTVPQKNAAGRALHLPRGKVLGGSHALNACIWVRGAVEDFTHWQKLGATEWGWEDVAPVYDRIAAYDGQPAAGRGTDGLRSEEHTSELQSLMRISYAVFRLKNKNKSAH